MTLIPLSSAAHPSHPARGAWIEIQLSRVTIRLALSHPARGAWIEIGTEQPVEKPPERRTPQGVRGLKCYNGDVVWQAAASRTPQGVRGLK